MATIGESLDEFIKALKAGKNPKLFFSESVMPDVIILLKREGFAMSEACLNRIPNENHRKMLETMLYSTAAFSLTGASIGGYMAGPKGAATGAAIGATCGLIAGGFVVYVSIDPRPDRGGYTVFASPSSPRPAGPNPRQPDSPIPVAVATYSEPSSWNTRFNFAAATI